MSDYEYQARLAAAFRKKRFYRRLGSFAALSVFFSCSICLLPLVRGGLAYLSWVWGSGLPSSIFKLSVSPVSPIDEDWEDREMDKEIRLNPA